MGDVCVALVVPEPALQQAPERQEKSPLRRTTIATRGDERDKTNLDAVEIGPLRPLDVEQAIAVLARGMRDNPNHVAAFGDDPALRLVRLGGYLESVSAIAGWQTLAARDRRGTILGVMAMTRPGDCRLSSLQEGRSLSSSASPDPEAAPLIAQWLKAWRERDPEERHWHLGPFAIEAHLQGMGIGSGLLRVFCAQLDAGEENAYLETDMRQSVGFFERFGFEVVAEDKVLGALNWFLLRRPRADRQTSIRRHRGGRSL